MTTPPKVLILGAGLIGLSTAYALQRQGAEVTITDARASAMRGTSHSNSAMIHPSQARPWLTSGDENYDIAAAKAVLSLARDSRRSLLKNFQDLELKETLSRHSGVYQIYKNTKVAMEAQKKYNKIGVETNVTLDPIKTLGHVALHFPDDNSGDAYHYGLALRNELKDKGTVFIYNAGGLILRRGQNGITAQFKGHIFHCDHVVICAGPHSAEIMKSLGLKLKLETSRGFAVDFNRPSIDLPESPLMDAESRSAMTILGNTLRLSGTLNEASAHPLLKRWFQLAPDIMKILSPARKIWSGLRPISVTGRPYISSTPIPGLWINTGHGHMGWTLSAGSGELMADMILNDKEDERFPFIG